MCLEVNSRRSCCPVGRAIQRCGAVALRCSSGIPAGILRQVCRTLRLGASIGKSLGCHQSGGVEFEPSLISTICPAPTTPTFRRRVSVGLSTEEADGCEQRSTRADRFLAVFTACLPLLQPLQSSGVLAMTHVGFEGSPLLGDRGRGPGALPSLPPRLPGGGGGGGSLPRSGPAWRACCVR